MLETNQMTDLDGVLQNLKTKELILSTAIDIQAVLRILVDKNIVTVDEVNNYREEVKTSPKYSSMQLYIDQTRQEAQLYKSNPEAALKAMMYKKFGGK